MGAAGVGHGHGPTAMQVAVEIIAEPERLSAAQSLTGLPDLPVTLTSLVQSATQLLDVSSGQVSLMTDEQVVLAGVGDARAGTTLPLPAVLCSLTLAGGVPLAVPDAAADERVAHLPGVSAGAVRAYLGVPVPDVDGRLVGSVSVWSSSPRSWTAQDVELLSLIARAVGTQLDLASLAAEREAEVTRWTLAADGARIGSFEWGLVSDELVLDDRLQALFGFAPGEFDGSVGSFTARVHPDDRPHVQIAADTAMTGGGDYDVEFRVQLPGGDSRWVRSRGKTINDPAGRAARLLGAAFDTTAARADEVHTSRVLESMPTGFASVDTEWRFTVVNASGERLWDRRREDLVGRSVREVFPGTPGSDFEAACVAAVNTGLPQTVLCTYPAPPGSWHEVQCQPTPDGLSLFFIDATQRVLADERARLAAARLELLAQVSSHLIDAVDAETATADLARLLVPAVADGMVVTLLAADGRPRDVACHHVDPGKRVTLRAYVRGRLDAMPPTAPLMRALATGEPVRSPGDDVVALLPPGRTRDLLTALDVRRGVVVPIRGRDRVLGALTIFSGDTQDPDSEVTALNVAGRAGMALDNSRLTRAQGQIAEGLQRSLLTAPPEPDHAHVVVRYEPASESARVGGDWYDAFLQPSGSTMLVIGDVAGHDIAAAAAMGQLRGLLRGIATYSDAGPAEVLRGLDAAMQLLQVGTLATAVVARLEQTADERERGVTRLVWANAGHPRPLVIYPDGSQHLLGDQRGQLLLGVDSTTVRHEQVVTLDRDTTVLLYSDGLVERRDSDIDRGIERLMRVVGELHGRSLDDLCDGVIERLVDGHPDDDVALVAVRLHRQDQPRPAEPAPARCPQASPADDVPAGAAALVTVGFRSR